MNRAPVGNPAHAQAGTGRAAQAARAAAFGPG